LRRVLVTGGLGFIGRHLVRRLLEQGMTVRVLDRYRDDALWQSRVELVMGDLSDEVALRSALRSVDTVFHLAGEKRDQSRFYSTNVEGTRNLLRAAAAAGVSRFLHLSSAGVIGACGQQVVTEETPCEPQNDYERSKYEGERIALDFAAWGELPVTALRPTNVFGEDDPEQHLATLIATIQRGAFRFAGHGEAMLNYLYVGDLAAACLIAVEREEAVGQVYLVADPCPLREFVFAIAEFIGVDCSQGHIPLWVAYGVAWSMDLLNRAFGLSLPLTVDKVRALTSKKVYSAEKIAQELGFRPSIGWREGLRRTVAWYEQNS